MKNVIYNYYNILVDNIKKDRDNYFFYYNDKQYLLYLVLNNIYEVKKIYEYSIKNNVECFKIITNNKNEFFSKVGNSYYALLELKGILNYEYSLNEFKITIINDKETDWGKIWGDRLDYYEIQIRQLGIKYQTVLNSFGLYHGIAENAILYYNKTISTFKENYTLSIMHNRIKYPCLLIDYNNPINFVIDYNIRDIAEYIKSYMLSNKYDIDEVINILNNYSFNNLMFNLLYTRLLYPNFYFDVFDNIILEDGKDNDIVNVLNYSSRYLNMLKEIYIYFNKKYNMFKIEWLDKIKM